MIDGIVQEDVDAYHPGFGKLYKWLLSAYNGRKSDITRRKALTKKAREDREAKREKDAALIEAAREADQADREAAVAAASSLLETLMASRQAEMKRRKRARSSSRWRCAVTSSA